MAGALIAVRGTVGRYVGTYRGILDGRLIIHELQAAGQPSGSLAQMSSAFSAFGALFACACACAYQH